MDDSVDEPETDPRFKDRTEGNESDYICEGKGHNFAVAVYGNWTSDGKPTPLFTISRDDGLVLNLCIRCGRFIRVGQFNEPVK